MWNIQWFDEIDSTNAEAARQVTSGAGVGTVIAARHQTAGRGRLDRTWEDQNAALLVSVVLPVSSPPFAMVATVALAMRDAVASSCKVRLHLKWPNDLLGAHGKVAGILAERAGDVLVVGIGVNVAEENVPESLRGIASSIEREMQGAGPTVEELLTAFLAHLARGMLREDWFDRYDLALSTRGQLVRVEQGSTTLVGRAEGIDDDGALRVVNEQGTHHIAVGDVIHIRPVTESPDLG